MSRNINCPLHGFVSLTPLMCSIVDTPEFKRLHNLRQLGVTYTVYPSANHTRFEHSLGVAHLAKVLIKSLQTHQPELNISDKDVELVQIAGLVHDIGHGPFSHLYDDLFIGEGQQEHEARGITIFKKLVRDHNIGLTTDEVLMITNMIEPCGDLRYNFMYQIVANKICSIDVDKIDYIQRDSYHIGFGLSEKYERLLTMCRVVNFEGNSVLAWPEKLQDEILSLFQTLYRLHRKVYTHHTVKAAEYIIEDIQKEMLVNVDTKFEKLNDSMIEWPVSKKVIKLKEKLDKRNFPKMLGEKVLCYNGHTEEIRKFEEKLDNIVTLLDNSEIENKGWSKIKIGFISGNGENPLKNVVYFNNSLQRPFRVEEYPSFIAPKSCQEYIYRIYLNDTYKLAFAKSLWNEVIKS